MIGCRLSNLEKVSELSSVSTVTVLDQTGTTPSSSLDLTMPQANSQLMIGSATLRSIPTIQELNQDSFSLVLETSTSTDQALSQQVSTQVKI